MRRTGKNSRRPGFKELLQCGRLKVPAGAFIFLKVTMKIPSKVFAPALFWLAAFAQLTYLAKYRWSPVWSNPSSPLSGRVELAHLWLLTKILKTTIFIKQH